MHAKLPILAFALTTLRVTAQTADLNIDSGSFVLKNSNDLISLSGGTSATGDGDILQFGYYTAATASQPFAGNWVALTGMGGADSAFSTTSIGDTTANGAGDGTFAFSLTFVVGSSSSGVSLPSVGQIMAIRFYNSTSVATASAYGSATDTGLGLDTGWLWTAPASPSAVMNFSLDDPGVKWLNNAVGFTDVTEAPEPSSLPLFAAGAVALALASSRLRRRSYPSTFGI